MFLLYSPLSFSFEDFDSKLAKTKRFSINSFGYLRNQELNRRIIDNYERLTHLQKVICCSDETSDSTYESEAKRDRE